MKRKTFRYILFVILEIFSFYLFSQGSWMINNLSMVGNLPQYRAFYFAWTFLFSITFFLPLINLKITKKDFLYQIVTITSFLAFLLSSFIPFDVDSADFLSLLHIPLAAISLICILISILYLMNRIKDSFPQYFLSLIKKVEIIISILSISILMFSQINSIVEFLFITLIIPFIYSIDDLIR